MSSPWIRGLQDKHWVDFHTQENAAFVNDSVHDKVNTPPVLYSVYLPMRDGVELAADVYLPKPYYKTAESLAMRSHRIALLDKALQKTQRRLTVLQQESERDEAAQRRTKEPKTVFKRYQEIRNLLHFQAHLEKRLKEETAEHDALLGSVKRLPVYLDITRYNRRTEAYWPLTMLRMWKNPRGASVNLWSFSAQQAFTANGYAVVVVDARGTGALMQPHDHNYAWNDRRRKALLSKKPQKRPCSCVGSEKQQKGSHHWLRCHTWPAVLQGRLSENGM